MRKWGADCLNKYTSVAAETAPGDLILRPERGEKPPCLGVGLIEKIDSRGSQGVWVAAGGIYSSNFNNFKV